MILHICTEKEWQGALAHREYRAASLEPEGFMHCSGAHQILGVANSFYAGQTGLVLLMIDPQKVSERLIWEDAAHPDPDAAPDSAANDQFPHIYGALNLDAVAEVRPFTSDDDGVFQDF